MVDTAARIGQIDAHVRARLQDSMATLAGLCAIPSVSARGQALEPCSEHVAALLRTAGAGVEILPTDGGPPVVVGTIPSDRHDAPTVLMYNHYDVQPPEPLELWDTDPFTLTVADGIATARGAADDKGHLVSRLASIEALRHACNGELPVNVRFVVEGEEECGSPHIGPFVDRHAHDLTADVCLWESGEIDEGGRPHMYAGMRGIAYCELHVRSLARDAHSGIGGSVLPNAAWRLIWALASLKDPDERIRIAGHYDRVRPASPADLALFADAPSDEMTLGAEFGIGPGGFLGGAPTTGPEFNRRAVMEPTLTVCGLDAGWQGAGPKTVIPAEAHAKIDFRLVPDQDPDETVSALRAHLDSHGFDDVEVRYLGGQKPARVDPGHPWLALARETCRDIHGVDPVIAPMVGGSGPMWWFTGRLGLPVAAPGVGYPGGRIHSPNEHIRLDDFVKGTVWTTWLLARYAETATAG